MRNHKTTAIAAAIAALAITGTASATTIDYASTMDADGVQTTTVAGATTIDFNDGSCGYSSCSGNYAILNGSASSHNAAPATGSGTVDSTDYLSVPNDLSQNPQSATFDLGTTANYFGLLWGSIDSYNTIDFLLDGTSVASFIGSDITTPNAANGDQASPTTNTYVNFYDLPTFDEVTLASTSYAFESDNHAYATIGSSDVPEPGNLALFGLAAIGLFAAFRRRYSNGAI